MGIRVHKMIGYGLTDVKVKDYQVADKRINSDSILLDYDRYDEANTEAYFEFAKQHPDVLMNSRTMFGAEVPDDDPFRSVVHETEFGLRNVLCIRPVGAQSWGWYRYDEAVDYMEESHVHDQKNRVEVFNSGIFPFDGFMNAETGARLTQDVYVWVRTKNDELKGVETLDFLAQHAGFKDHAEASRLVVPSVPPEVRALAEFGQLFTSDDVWKQLRPMLYVYWG